MQNACNDNKNCLSDIFSEKKDNNAPFKLFLALQGGGSHGAFEAGVIQALQEDGILPHVKGISGVSAGAFNAAPLSYALNAGKPEMAPGLLVKAWNEVAHDSHSTSIAHSLARVASHFVPFLEKPVQYPNLPQKHVKNLESLGQLVHLAQVFGVITQSGDIKNRMNEIVPDWDVIQDGEIETIIGATQIERKGSKTLMHEKLFRNQEIDADAIAASATLIGTHVKGGKEYVDGGYTTNPPLQPALDGGYSDIIIIMLSRQPDVPLTPKTQKEQFNGLDFLHDEVYNEIEALRQSGKINVHVIEMEHEPHWDATSKMNSEPKWINDLYIRGLEAGRKWALENAQHIGKQSTFRPDVPSVEKCEKCDLDKRPFSVA